MKKQICMGVLFAVTLVLFFALLSCGTTTSTTEPAGNGSSQNDQAQTAPEQSVNHYSVSWFDEDGKLLDITTVEEGNVPSKNWAKQNDAEWIYTVKGWSTTQGGTALETLPAASENTSYYAVVEKTKQQYTVTFNTNGGNEISSETRCYGDVLQKPENPKKEGFRFVAWCSDAELNHKVEFPYTVTGHVTLYASYNVKVDTGRYLEALLEGYDMNPLEYIPETMRYNYSPNLVTEDEVTKDYSSFVNKADIVSRGFGEQWNMIADNLNQSMAFFRVLSVVENLTSTSVTAFNNYLDTNPEDTAQYQFASGIYNVTIRFDGTHMYYVLDYSANVFGSEQSVQIALSLDINTNAKDVRVMIGDANALRYCIEDDSYTFAIKYLGVRRAYFKVEKLSDGSVEGSINEYLTVAGKGVHSAADFYIDEDYLTAVGNKASGIPGFTGYISEVYDVKNGKMLGYEVRETLSAITYNTLWFDLSDISGIDSIKFTEKTDTEDAAFYVNGSSEKWQNKKVGGLSLKTASRRFDIEFRTQYFYTYNAETEEYEALAVEVPMLFVQQENYDTFAADVKSVNSSLNVAITMSSGVLDKIKSEYQSKVDAFIQHKDSVTEDSIVSFIGDKVRFD